MTQFTTVRARRDFLAAAAMATISMGTRCFADELLKTPKQMEGPFYPDKLPLDTDNDLLVINDGLTPAVGEVTHLTGRILDASGNPLRGALVEIWQCDSRGVYLHSGSSGKEKQDANFQGFGRFLTGANGDYYFRTIKPVPYPGRTPHIHFQVKHKGNDPFTTQCYIKGHPQNERDFVFKAAGDAKARELLSVDFSPIPQSRASELAAKFDIVLGYTPSA
jgi:protocatechuate 3,4-dioxygenase beta subunit